MSARPDPRGERPDPETEQLVRAIGRQSPFTLSEGGPEGEALRAKAFRVMVLRPLARLWRALLRRLGRKVGPPPPAYRAETARETRPRRE